MPLRDARSYLPRPPVELVRLTTRRHPSAGLGATRKDLEGVFARSLPDSMPEPPGDHQPHRIGEGRGRRWPGVGAQDETGDVLLSARERPLPQLRRVFVDTPVVGGEVRL